MGKPIKTQFKQEIKESDTNLMGDKLTEEQIDVQRMITKEVGSYIDALCNKYEVAMDFKVMIYFPKSAEKDTRKN